ncbi:MAG: hypothetical protein ACUVWJ_09720 [Spirochaetota bacterium]
MQILVFSDHQAIKKSFSSLGRVRAYSLQFYPASKLNNELKKTVKGSLIYIDLSSLAPDKQKIVLRLLSRQEGLSYGVIDRSGVVKDPASLFHDGASDYIGPYALSKGINPARVRKILSYNLIQGEKKASSIAQPEISQKRVESLKKAGYSISYTNWNKIEDGKEYLFWLMYIELDHLASLKDTLAETQYTTLIKCFRSFVERIVAGANGRLWIWDDNGGLVLFPYNGTDFEPVLTCYRLILSRRIYNIEVFSLSVQHSYRIALDVGITVYRSRGRTGTIVSGAINDIFNLGKKFCKPGNFYITEKVFEIVPEGLKKQFLPVGNFQGNKIMRMRLTL